MTLLEISREYEYSAALIRQRLSALRYMERTCTTAARQKELRRRQQELRPLLHDCRAMARKTANYYTKGGK